MATSVSSSCSMSTNMFHSMTRSSSRKPPPRGRARSTMSRAAWCFSVMADWRWIRVR
ncbi:Uncharacterised protein [Bordetella pertussis]|nr:Uncharacterised protein [Bordetella pertussis]